MKDIVRTFRPLRAPQKFLAQAPKLPFIGDRKDVPLPKWGGLHL
jgi:hypothetical protein